MPPSRKLVAFDFDHTIVDGNTDIHIKNLAPNGAIPEEIKRKYSDRCWIDYMGQIFVYLHSHGISASDYQNCLASLPLTAGMRELLNHLKSQNAELIIVSDSNSEFIRMSLEQHQLADNFHSVITNPASFAPTGLLEIRYCHEQNWCDLR